jgi:hypothetical protein
MQGAAILAGLIGAGALGFLIGYFWRGLELPPASPGPLKD